MCEPKNKHVQHGIFASKPSTKTLVLFGIRLAKKVTSDLSEFGLANVQEKKPQMCFQNCHLHEWLGRCFVFKWKQKLIYYVDLGSSTTPSQNRPARGRDGSPTHKTWVRTEVFLLTNYELAIHLRWPLTPLQSLKLPKMIHPMFQPEDQENHSPEFSEKRWKNQRGKCQ